MVAIVVILSRIEIPAAHLLTIHTVVVYIPDESAPIVLGQERSISLLPGFILNVGCTEVLGKRRKNIVLDVRAATREGGIVETPERAELAEGRQRAVDKVLVCAWEVVVDDPMEIALQGRELDVDPVGARVGDGSGSPGKIRGSAICSTC